MVAPLLSDSTLCAHVSGKAVEDGPSTCGPYTQVEDEIKFLARDFIVIQP